jgi:hypothetical protein
VGLFFRSLFRAGPLRFNISKRGLGVSTGIRGLRVGASKRGAYVSAAPTAFAFKKQSDLRDTAGSGGGFHE